MFDDCGSFVNSRLVAPKDDATILGRDVNTQRFANHLEVPVGGAQQGRSINTGRNLERTFEQKVHSVIRAQGREDSFVRLCVPIAGYP